MLFLGREASTPLDLVIGLPPDQRLTCVDYDDFVQLVERRATEANEVPRKHLRVRTPIVVRILRRPRSTATISSWRQDVVSLPATLPYNKSPNWQNHYAIMTPP